MDKYFKAISGSNSQSNWVRPKWWADMPVVETNDILLLVHHESDRLQSFNISTSGGFNADVYFNDVYIQNVSGNNPGKFDIDPNIYAITEKGERWTWVKIKVLVSSVGGRRNINIGGTDPIRFKGSSYLFNTLELISNVKVGGNIVNLPSINFSPLASNRCQMLNLRHLNTMGENPVAYRYLPKLEHVSNMVNRFRDVRYSNIDYVGEFTINQVNIRDVFRGYTGLIDMKLIPLRDIRQCYAFPRSPRLLIGLEITDLSNNTYTPPNFSNCYNMQRLKLGGFNRNTSLMNCYLMSEQALLDMLNSFADMNGEPSPSINLENVNYYQSVVDLAMAKNWTLLNYN